MWLLILLNFSLVRKSDLHAGPETGSLLLTVLDVLEYFPRQVMTSKARQPPVSLVVSRLYLGLPANLEMKWALQVET